MSRLLDRARDLTDRLTRAPALGTAARVSRPRGEAEAGHRRPARRVPPAAGLDPIVAGVGASERWVNPVV